jgi:type IV secretion system protein VirB1
MIAPVALAALLSSCAPSVAPDTMTAIVDVESGRNPFALHDNSTGRSYAPQAYREALTIASALIGQRHSVDVGLAQINSGNFAGYRTNAAAMLFPCQNLIVASQILGGAYATAQAAFPEPSVALFHSLGAYNTGSIHAGAAYASRVVSAASVPSITVITGHPDRQADRTSEIPKLPSMPSPTPRPTPVPVGSGDWGSP